MVALTIAHGGVAVVLGFSAMLAWQLCNMCRESERHASVLGAADGRNGGDIS